MQTALIFGITGQDGSYLAESLLSKGYLVIGVVRRCSTTNLANIEHLKDNPCVKLVEGDITDSCSVTGIINHYKPQECYNLAAQSHVHTSFSQPQLTLQVNSLGPLNILEAIRHFSPATRFYQASTSEMYGNEYDVIWDQTERIQYQDEETKFSPNSPYSISKVAAHNLVQSYRTGYGLHASCGILFNHESERRGENFVTRKITKWIGEFTKWMNVCVFEEHNTEALNNDYIYAPNYAKFPKLRLGNLDTKRDWGYAPDYVEAMWMMLQKDKPGDYVICTEQGRSIREFLDTAFQVVGITDWPGLVKVDPLFYRPNDINFLCGNSSKAKRELGWIPKVSFEEMVERMVKHDVQEAAKRS